MQSNRLKTITAAAARELAEDADVFLDLSGLAALPEDVAHSLARCRCNLGLNGLSLWRGQKAPSRRWPV